MDVGERIAAEVHMPLAHAGLLTQEPGADKRLAHLQRVTSVIGGRSAVEVVELSVVLVAHLAHAQQAPQHGARAPAAGAGVVLNRQACGAGWGRRSIEPPAPERRHHLGGI